MADNTAALPSIVEFSENIGDAEAVPPLPKGDYRAVIEGITVKMSKNDNKYAQIRFMIRPDQFPADYDAINAPNGRIVMYNRIVLEDNPQARYSLRQFCEAIGAPMARRIDVNEWVQREAMVSVGHDEYNGVQRETVDKVARA